MAFLSVWNEGENIKEIVDQIYPWIDKLVIVDGRYEKFPGTEIRSNDLILENFMDITGIHNRCDIHYNYTRKPLSGHMIVEKKLSHFPIYIILPSNQPWKNEMAKRSVMFHYGNEGDWFLVIDGDERIRTADWIGLRDYLTHIVDPSDFIVGVPLFDHKTGLKWHAPRLIRYLPNTVYDQNHYTLRIEEQFYDMVNDASRRHDLPEEPPLLEFDHFNRKEYDLKRWEDRVYYYKYHMATLENPTPYNVGKNRYHRQTNRWTMEPIHKETQRRMLEEIERKRE